MSKNYIVYFEIGNKKMKMKVFAPAPEFAKEAVRKKIIFHKVEEESLADELGKMFKEIFKPKK